MDSKPPQKFGKIEATGAEMHMTFGQSVGSLESFSTPSPSAWTEMPNQLVGPWKPHDQEMRRATHVIVRGIYSERRLSDKAGSIGVNYTAGKTQGVSMNKLQYMRRHRIFDLHHP